MKDKCLHCDREVRPRQEAIQCDGCNLWQHRLCNTGISRDQYRRMVKETESIEWKCLKCTEEANATPEDDVNSDQPDDVAADTENAAPPADDDATLTSVGGHQATFHISMDSTNSEAIDTPPRLNATFNLSLNTEVSDNTSFDVNEPFAVHRPVEEDSIREDSIQNVSVQEDIGDPGYEVVEMGTTRGKTKLVDSTGFSYTVKKRKGEDITYWRCTKRTKNLQCPATVMQRGDAFQCGRKSHIHPPEPGVKIAVKIKTKVKENARSDVFTTSAPMVVEETIWSTADPSAPAASRPKPSNLIRTANRVRQTLRPSDPEDLDFELATQFLDVQTPQFIFRDIFIDGKRHLLLYTDRQLQLLAKAKIWYMDATFRVVHNPWMQLFSIHSFVRSGDNMKQIPLMFCFMSGKSANDYYEVLRTVDRALPNNIELTGFVLDFEAGMWTALRRRFPGFPIQGCVFHWTQAVFRKVQENGLQSAYNTRGDVYTFLRQVMALPFLPPEHIEETFHELDRRASTPQLDAVMDYVFRQWLRNDIFPVKSWSVFMTSVRTNNDVEGWHNRLNSRVNLRGPVLFYLLICELYKEAANIPMQLRLVSKGS